MGLAVWIGAEGFGCIVGSNSGSLVSSYAARCGMTGTMVVQYKGFSK